MLIKIRDSKRGNGLDEQTAGVTLSKGVVNISVHHPNIPFNGALSHGIRLFNFNESVHSIWYLISFLIFGFGETLQDFVTMIQTCSQSSKLF